MPAHLIDLQDQQAMGRLLLAIVLSTNRKELRVKAVDYDSIDRGRLLVLDFDRETSELVLRATTSFGKALVVQPEAVQWSLPFNQAPREVRRSEATKEASRRAVPTDEELAAMEEAAARRQNLASMEDEGKSPLRINVKK